jgi:hypothetical protein
MPSSTASLHFKCAVLTLICHSSRENISSRSILELFLGRDASALEDLSDRLMLADLRVVEVVVASSRFGLLSTVLIPSTLTAL